MVNRDLYLFNPTCETAIANGSETYMAAQILREFENDLSILPMIFASADDYVLSSVKPSDGFIRDLKNIGFPVSNWATKEKILNDRELHFNQIIPWGWSPAAHFQLNEIKKRVSGSFCNSKVFYWTKEYKTLFERKTSALILKRFLSVCKSDIYCSSEAVPSILQSEPEISRYLENYQDMVLKSPISSSGRGVQMIRNGKLSASNWQWIKAVLNQSGYIMAEPLHRKKLDLSFQFEIDASGKVIYHGCVFFYTNSNGMYQGHYLHQSIDKLLGTDFSGLLNETGAKLQMIIEDSEYATLHEGFLGVDGMIIDEGGTLKIHPCLEINCRLTMGMLALRIQQLIHSESKGRFEIFTGKIGEFAAYSEEMIKKHPVVMKDHLFFSGFSALTEPLRNAKFGAYVLLY